METALKSFRFGPYEARGRTRELYKYGVKLKIRPQPFLVLNALLSRSGDVVTRDELRQLLWSTETFVDFEHSLNTSIKELRAVLGDSATEPRYIQTLPRLGYRFIGTVDAADGTAASPAAPAGIVAPTSAPPMQTPEPAEAPVQAAVYPRQFPWRWVGVLGLVVVVLAVFGVYELSRSRFRLPRPGATERKMLAVLPFENLTGDPEQEYFSDGLTEEMVAQLSRVDPERMGVIARTSVMNYKKNPKPLDQVRRELGVDYVLEGSVRRDASSVRVSAQLIQLKDQTHLWSRQYDRELSGLLALQTEIAQEIADEIQLTLGAKRTRNAASRPAPAAPASYEAYDLYLKGRYFWNKRTESGFHQAADYFQQAIDKDPNYARAYAGLADTLALMSTWNYVPARDFMPRARVAALKALQIDGSMAEAHASLALIAEHYDYDWQTAEEEFRRAIQLDPDYATAHQWYAECLGFQARFDDAFAESERARQLDPLSLVIATDHAMILYYSRNYDRAINQFREVREMDPDFPRSSLIVFAYIEAGEFTEALATAEELARRNHEENSPFFWAKEAYIFGRWGREADAQRVFTGVEEQLKRHPLPDPALVFLWGYLALGRKDDALTTLQKLYTEHTNVLVQLKVDPLYDPLRGDPRFQDLLRRAHLAD
jgi:TolB-like protein/DNA-binding winged helix-turn-helix (wHTH) protein/Tfp pilus assembly protein PilF